MPRLLGLFFLFLLAFAARAEALRADPRLMPAGKESAKAAPTRQASPDRVFRVDLPPAAPEELGANLAPSGKDGAPLQIGFGRGVTLLRDAASLRSRLSWSTTASGTRVAAISITSPDAAAIRLALETASLPADALVRFYGTGDRVFEVTGLQIQQTIARNLASRDPGIYARSYIAPAIEGDTAVVEFELPAATPDEQLRVSIPSISHFVAAPGKNFVMPKAAAACENNVCSYAAWDIESRAVARMTFCDGPQCYWCTGTLIADTDAASTIPYFLSANHCINTQTVASTLQTDWLYRTCSTTVTRTGGATLLYASGTTDTSFMQLNDAPPAGTAFAGWISGAAPANGTDVTAIHHPAGDLQKISFGDIDGYWICSPRGHDMFTCSTSTVGAGTFYGVVWRSGITEGGSSGSAIFDDAGQHVLGQLYGGSSGCTSPGARDYYGRFDVAFNSKLSQWLSPPALTSVVSRKSHASAGSFDFAINTSAPINSTVSVEPRAAGTGGHSLVFTFGASITSAGTVASTDVNGLPLGLASTSIAANAVVVSLASIPENSRVKVTLSGVNGSGASYSAAVGFLVGDEDGLGSVNSLDLEGVKDRSGQVTDGANYLHDVNLSGAITAADILMVKGRMGLVL